MVSISLSWHLHYLGVPTATEASPFAKAFQGLSVKILPRCQTQDSFHSLSILKLSCLPNQYHLGNSYTLPSLAANFRCSPSPLHHRFYVPALKKHVPLHRFYPSNAKLFLITYRVLNQNVTQTASIESWLPSATSQIRPQLSEFISVFLPFKSPQYSLLSSRYSRAFPLTSVPVQRFNGFHSPSTKQHGQVHLMNTPLLVPTYFLVSFLLLR